MAAAGNNAANGLLLGAGLFLTISFITLSVMVYIPAQDGAKAATQKFSSITTELSQSEYVVYDNSKLSGSQVINSIRKYTGKNNEFGVAVKTGKAGSLVWYGRVVSTTPGSTYGSVIADGQGSIANAQNEISEHYVNPNGNFESQVIKDNNNMVRAIIYTQIQ